MGSLGHLSRGIEMRCELDVLSFGFSSVTTQVYSSGHHHHRQLTPLGLCAVSRLEASFNPRGNPTTAVLLQRHSVAKSTEDGEEQQQDPAAGSSSPHPTRHHGGRHEHPRSLTSIRICLHLP